MEKLVENKRQYERVCDVVSAMQYGDTITHRQLSEAIGEKVGTTKYYSIIQKARRILLSDYKICLESVREIGYRKVIPDDFVKLSINEYKYGFKRIQNGEKILVHAPVNDMSEQGREEYRHVHDRAVQLKAVLGAGVVELKLLSSRQPHPLENAISR